jgi:site-specific DNA recombinase
MAQAHARCQRGKFDVVVAEALDRISRDQEDLAGIYKRLRFEQIEIWTVQNGVAGEIHVGVKGLVGALYLKDLVQKTRRRQAGVIRDVRHNGGRSYGYRAVAGKPGFLKYGTMKRLLSAAYSTAM